MRTGTVHAAEAPVGHQTGRDLQRREQRCGFPAFDRVLIPHDELQSVIEDSRYVLWRTALATVQGIHLIADTSTGKLYIGMADGGERLLGPMDDPLPRRPWGQRRAARARGG